VHDSRRIEPREHEREHASTGLPVIAAVRFALLPAEVAEPGRAGSKHWCPTSHDVRALPVEKVDMIVIAYPHVAGRDVAMNDAAGMRGAQAANELGRVAQQASSRLRSHAPP